MSLKKCEISRSRLSETMAWLEKELSDMKVSQKEIMRAELLLEETFLCLANFSEQPDSFVGQVRLRKLFGDISLYFSARGEAFNPLDGLDDISPDEDNLYNMAILKACRDDLSYSRRNGENIIAIRVHSFSGKFALYTVASMVFGCLLGSMLELFLADETCLWLEMNLFTPIESMFMHALMMMLAPMIFFSVMSGLVNMSNATEIGRLGSKLVAVSIAKLSASIAIAIGFGIWLGAVPELAGMIEAITASNTATVSVIKLIVGIIPENIVSPFFSGNLLQVLFLSCFFGFFLVKSGERAAAVKGSIEFLNNFINDVIKSIMLFIPVAVTASMAKMMLHTEPSMLLVFGKVILVSYAAELLVLGMLCIFVGIVGRCSLMPFLKKTVVFLALPFSIRSSSACMSEMIQFCKNKLGIEEKMAIFSLPLGLQLNMNGTGAYIVILAIFMRMTLGLPIDADFLLSFFFTMLLLTFASPAAPGAGLILQATALEMAGVPKEAVMILVGIDPIIDCIRSAINVAGNVSSSFLLARMEQKIDMEIYNRM